jgi:hypothetical protein
VIVSCSEPRITRSNERPAARTYAATTGVDFTRPDGNGTLRSAAGVGLYPVGHDTPRSVVSRTYRTHFRHAAVAQARNWAR